MYERIVAAVCGQPWAIEPGAGRTIATVLTNRVNGKGPDPAAVEAAVALRRPKRNPRAGSVALVPLHGVMTQRADWFTELSGMTSTEAVGRMLDEAAADPGVEAIVLDVDSPGGSVFGTAELADKVAEIKKTKKVVAVANSLAASGAFYVASQASELVVTPSGMVGSIGVLLFHVDRSKANEMAGEVVTLVSAGPRKGALDDSRPLGPEGRAEMDEIVTGYYDLFVKAVARGRGVTQAAVRAGFGKGGVVLAEPAVKEGMADKVGTLESVLARYGVTPADLAPAAAAAVPEPRSGVDFDLEVRRRRLLMN